MDLTPRRWTYRSPRRRPDPASGSRRLRVRTGSPGRRGQCPAVSARGRRSVRPGSAAEPERRRRYLTSLAEVRAYGSATSTVRTPQQTDVALFWEPAIEHPVRADLARGAGGYTSFAGLAGAVRRRLQRDHHRRADRDLQRQVQVRVLAPGDGDPNRIGRSRSGWTPLFTTPRYPDWPSGHGGFAGAAQEVLTAFLGPARRRSDRRHQPDRPRRHARTPPGRRSPARSSTRASRRGPTSDSRMTPETGSATTSLPPI